MYIRARQLWLLIPIFTGLFLLGAALALLQKEQQEQIQPLTVIDLSERIAQDREHVASLMKRAGEERKQNFQVKWQQNVLSGYYQGEAFSLTGQVEGHEVTLKRDGSQFHVAIDGEPQDPALVPYALYTPYEHARLIMGQLPSIEPLPLSDPAKPAWAGYQFRLSPEEVTSLVQLWLGPSFSAAEMMLQLKDDILISYQLWYEAETKQLKQVVLDLALNTETGKKEDRLIFEM